ncbi:nucleotidyltransferase [Thermocladium modestius]|uniref:Nucleotidyltransferase n=2 Tax=Thermocladium modestius TaxID=62609 RepID=A0A830GU71_9CREN|nr:nucleotidyltransferase [Thermocladium modestius]
MEQDMKALILAGGFGKRLMPLTIDQPKPLVEIGGKPILVRQIEWLRGQGISDIILAVGHLRTKVFEKLGDGSKYGVRLFYSVEEEPLGTEGAIKNASKYIDTDLFVVTNGDVITDIDVSALVKGMGDGLATIALVPMRSPYGIVEVDENGYVKSFKEKPLLEYMINAGVYVMKRKTIDMMADKGDIEKGVFPKLAREGKIRAVIYNNSFWRSIDTVKDVEEVSAMLAAKQVN